MNNLRFFLIIYNIQKICRFFRLNLSVFTAKNSLNDNGHESQFAYTINIRVN